MQIAGTFSIGNLADSGTVTGLNLASSVIPRRIFPKVRKPAGGLNMFANIVDGTMTQDGFDFTLSGETDSADYKLDYLIVAKIATHL